MAGLAFDINTKQFEKELTADVEKSLKILDGTMSAEFNQAVVDAGRIVPIDLGGLKSSIEANTEVKLKHELIAKEFYAVYVEFGTGNKVVIPPPFKPQDDGDALDYGPIAREAAEKAAALMPSKTKRQLPFGMSPQPFLVPSFQEAVKRIILSFDKLKL